jgi:hypothetical protein
MSPTSDPVVLVENFYAPTEKTPAVSFRTFRDVAVCVTAAVLQAPGTKPSFALAARQSEATLEVVESSPARLARASKRENLIYDLDSECGCRSLVQIMDSLDAKELSPEPLALRLQLRRQHLVQASSVAQLHQRIEDCLLLSRPRLSCNVVHVVHRVAAVSRAAQVALLVVAAHLSC